MFTKIIYWQNHPSIHQSAFVRALAERDNTEVWFAYEEDIPASRQAMGWTCPDHGKAKLVDVREASHFESLVSMDDAETLHLFGAFFNLPVAKRALQRLKKKPCTRVWTTEAFNFTGWRGKVRLWRSRWLAITQVNRVFSDVFAMGNLGVEFFRKSWVNSAKIHEFAYLVEPPYVDEAFETKATAKTVTRILYVGQLIDRKGVDVLLDALARVGDFEWTLEVIGDGNRRSDLSQYARKLGLDGRIEFRGNMPNVDVLRAIRKADVLVLPSRWDGWGAVVNEALMLGTQVVASDRCGAGTLLRTPLNGHVFKSENPEDLAAKLKGTISESKFDSVSRKAREQWAAEVLNGSSLAAYFLSSIHFLNINRGVMPPWC